MLRLIHRYLRKLLPVQRFRLHNHINSFPVLSEASLQNSIRAMASVVPGILFPGGMKAKMGGLAASRQGNLFSPT